MTATTTIIGNTTADVELRYTANGIAVANFTVASTEKVLDRQANEWKDGKKLFMRCTAWRELAEHLAGSIPKGTRVLVVGKMATREFEDREGNKRTTIELEVDEIGPSLRYATAQITRAQSNRGAPTQQAESWEPSAPADEAWSGGAGYGDETPF